MNLQLEAINPFFEAILTDKTLAATWRYYASNNAPRLTNDTYFTYKLAQSSGVVNSVNYVSGDVRDEESWVPLANEKFKFSILNKYLLR